LNNRHPLAGLVLPVTLVALTLAILYGGRVLAPVTLALFLVALVWPMQTALERRLPRGLALLASTTAIVLVTLGFAWLVFWALSRVAVLSLQDASRFQTFYANLLKMLNENGIATQGILAGSFDTRWIIQQAQSLGGRINSILVFLVVTVVYTTLGLLEVRGFRDRILAALPARGAEPGAGALIVQGCVQTAAKVRRYMVVRSQMSVLTGLLAYLFLRLLGVENALEWGVVTFVLNYIPFLGPLIATLFPTAFALIQFESWQMMVLVFVGLNVVQTVVGSYVEPLV
jgi:predicted PurR-regulated permease PerM